MPCPEVASGRAEHHRDTAGHVLAAVVAATLHDDARARVTDGQALTRTPRSEEAAAGRAVEHGIPDDGVLGGGEGDVLRGFDDDLAARHALADVVLRLTLQGQLHTADVKHPERLPGHPAEVILNGGWRQSSVAVNTGDLSGQARADRALAVGDRVASAERFTRRDGLDGVLIDRLVERRRVLGAVVAPRL
jgi:hypothetical protein